VDSVISPPRALKPTLTGKRRQKVDIFTDRGSRHLSRIDVRALPHLPGRNPSAVLSVGPFLFLPCAIGRKGIGVKQREGDSITPLGQYKITAWFHRIGQLKQCSTGCRIISPKTGWCDDPNSFAYNRKVSLPFRFGAESLWREDALYDIIGVINFNMRPRIRGRGSAIFLHVAGTGFPPTAGCVALPKAVLQKLKLRLAARPQVFIDNGFARRSPKIAEPTRILVAPN
jgi:L,D-peptidoglycan transpeptidase YkuD (ErfK/YbiS/YcfS/YnhG family)